jgi:hypothetical protein
MGDDDPPQGRRALGTLAAASRPSRDVRRVPAADALTCGRNAALLAAVLAPFVLRPGAEFARQAPELPGGSSPPTTGSTSTVFPLMGEC